MNIIFMETTQLTFVEHCKDKFISNDGNVVPDDMEGKEVMSWALKTWN